jgi:hypothetical protein
MVTPWHAVADAHLVVSQLRKVLDEVVMSTPFEGKPFTSEGVSKSPEPCAIPERVRTCSAVNVAKSVIVALGVHSCWYQSTA